MSKWITIIATTIRELERWKYFAENFDKYAKGKRIRLLVCDDQCKVNHADYLEKFGIPFQVVNKDVQHAFFKEHFGEKWEDYSKIIKYDPSYKQMGFLIAAPDSEIIINIDDDIVPQGDFIGGHSVINQEIQCKEVFSSTNWFNTCSMMNNNQNRTIYARGYQYSKRKETYTYSTGKGRVVLNMGHWSDIPDLDAITFLHEDSGGMNGITDIRQTTLKEDRLMIGKGVQLPVCIMNTAFSPAILPAFYQTLQNVDIRGWTLGRYDDIWSGVLAKKVIDAVGDKVTVGVPLVKHEKTPRDIFMDMQKEFIGILVSQRFYDALEKVEINSSDYFGGYQQLIDGLRKQDIYNDDAIMDYFRKFFDYMELWLKIVDKVV
jgi:hypothetical protein